MYTKVQTMQEQEVFNRIWEECWDEKGFEFEYFEGTDQFVFWKDGQAIACVELKKYNIKDEVFGFSECEHLKGQFERVMEIDKLSILKEHRGMGMLEEIIFFLMEYMKEKELSYFTTLLEPRLFITLKRMFRLPVEEVGKRFLYKGDIVVPTTIDVQEAIRRETKMKWYIETKERKLNLLKV